MVLVEEVELKTHRARHCVLSFEELGLRNRTIESLDSNSATQWRGKLNFFTCKVWKQVPTLYARLWWEGDEIEHGSWVQGDAQKMVRRSGERRHGLKEEVGQQSTARAQGVTTCGRNHCSIDKNTRLKGVS